MKKFQNLIASALTKERILSLMRFIPYAVLLYSTIHTVEAVIARSSSFVEGAFLLVGMATVEIILLSSHALYEGNYVSGLQRIFAGVMLLWSLTVIILNVIAKSNGLSHEFATTFYSVILPSSPIQAMILTVGFFIADDESRLKAKEQANETRLQYLRNMGELNKRQVVVKAQAKTLAEFNKSFRQLLSKTGSEMKGEVAVAAIEEAAQQMRNNILSDLNKTFDLAPIEGKHEIKPPKRKA